ncbi:MAG: DNA repair protein RecN [Bacteroidales bacterium]|nr:DNA repair protein RecN [Bacteroidales bacterium]
MLRRLKIDNYALIDHLELDFESGLTIITGETGAGKSIMLGALSLILGGRADSRVIADGGARSVVEASFCNVDPSLRSLLEERGVEWVADQGVGSDHLAGSGEIIIRRDIAANGRSRVFINDHSVTLATLSAVAERLVDIHSQHANAKISDPAEQLHIIDAFSDNEQELEAYRREFTTYLSLRRRIKAVKEQMARTAEEESFLRFQYEQLDKLKPRHGELEEIERRFEVLSDADEIKNRLSEVEGFLGPNAGGALLAVGEAQSLASRIDFSLFRDSSEEENDDANSIERRLADVAVELRDIYESVADINEQVDTDPAALSRLSDRMNSYYEAIKRFRVKDASALVELYHEIRRKLGGAGQDGVELPELEKEARAQAKILKEKAGELSETRRRGAESFSRLIAETARPLGLKNLAFEALVSTGKLSSSGQDTVTFLCSFNKNGRLQPLSEVASGGEVSRMMLSLKQVMSERIALPTIIFDEVDTGVSGSIADLMGQMMRRMGERMQVIVITHLPQVAAKGKSHFKVYKHDEEQRTVTDVRRLSHEERIREIAGMMSGTTVGEAALDNARALLDE